METVSKYEVTKIQDLEVLEEASNIIKGGKAAGT
jgi:hypothetical protein